MKSYKNIIFSLFLIFFLFACNEEKFIEETPISNISVQSYFKTTQHFDEAVIGSYAYLRNLSQVFFWSIGEMRSDNSTFQYNNETQSGYHWWDLDKFVLGGVANNSVIDPSWNQLYAGIGRCNTVLHYIEDIDIDKKAQFVAEVKFLRAFYYFTLVRYWGNVPLVTKKVESMEEAFQLNKQVSPEEVYKQIIEDLNDSKGDLPKSYASKDIGRATSGAARMLLGKVLMWRGQYKDAATEFEAIISSQQYSLINDYSSVFGVDNENNEEIIFSVQNIEGVGLGQSSNYMYRFAPWNLETASTEVYGFPFNVVAAGHVGMNIPTESLLNSFEKGDVRKNMIDTTFIDRIRPVYQDSIVPFTLKYVDYTHSRINETGVNFPIFRYPHVLLSLAECYVREGGGDPQPLVNQVRNRAQLKPIDNITLADIIHERRVEFHCECDRWDVLVRTGLAQSVMEAHGKEEINNRDEIPNNAYSKIKILLPIPNNELTIDNNLKQNPEYL